MVQRICSRARETAPIQHRFPPVHGVTVNTICAPAFSADHLISLLEATECATHTTRAARGRLLLPLLLQTLTTAALLVAPRIEQANY
jgi:hypothetical protein